MFQNTSPAGAAEARRLLVLDDLQFEGEGCSNSLEIIVSAWKVLSMDGPSKSDSSKNPFSWTRQPVATWQRQPEVSASGVTENLDSPPDWCWADSLGNEPREPS